MGPFESTTLAYPTVLSPEEVEFYEQNGYLVLPKFLSDNDVNTLRDRMAQKLLDLDPKQPRSIFSTTGDQEQRDQYFLDSANKISFFYEEEAVGADGSLQVPIDRAINKVGHALHELDHVFRDFSRNRRLVNIAKDIGYHDPQVVQSMYIFKQPKVGGKVVWHQDATFLYTEPNSTSGLWFALEEANQSNGCLWVIPGGHKESLRQRFIRHEDNRLEMRDLDSNPYNTAEAIPVEVPSGSLVILHGLLPHMSEPNRSPQSRHAYALHLIDGTSHYSENNWLQF